MHNINTIYVTLIYVEHEKTWNTYRRIQRKKGFLARVFVLTVMRSKLDAFRNHMVYMNLKNLNMKKMPYSTKGFSMQMNAQK